MGGDVCTLVLTPRAVLKHTVLMTRKMELNKRELDKHTVEKDLNVFF